MKSLLAGFRFLLASPLVGGIALLGGLLTMAVARCGYCIRRWLTTGRCQRQQIGFLYAAIPLGAAIGALTSGKLAHSARPGLLMLLSTLGSFLAIGLFGLMPMWILGVVCLALFGWLSAVSSLLQYTMLGNANPGSDVRAD